MTLRVFTGNGEVVRFSNAHEVTPMTLGDNSACVEVKDSTGEELGFFHLNNIKGYRWVNR